MLKRFGFALALTVVIPSAASAEPIRLGLEFWLGYGPLWVADKNGYFERHGVEVEFSVIAVDEDMRDALQNGDIDVAASPTNGLILDVSRGIAQKGSLVLDTSLEADAIVGGPKNHRDCRSQWEDNCL